MKKQQKTSLAKGKDDMSLLEQRIAELEEVRFGEPVPSSWLRQRNRKFAYHEAAHATARMFTGQSNSIKKVTIVPCAEYGGRVTSRKLAATACERKSQQSFIAYFVRRSESRIPRRDVSKLIIQAERFFASLAGRRLSGRR